MEEGEENMPRNEWEFVSLTASTYAAAPGPKEAKDVAANESKDAAEFGTDETQTSRSLFNSGHFVFPPSEHENLPVETLKPDSSEVVDSSKVVDKDELPQSRTKEEEDWSLKGLDAHEFQDIYRKKGTTLQGLDLIDNSQSLYDADAEFSSLHHEEALDESNGKDTAVAEPLEAFQQEISLSPKPLLDDKYKNSDLPCEAWWKKKAVSFYAHAKEANAFWSIFIAAAVVGIVIVGQRWQQERSQAL